jgi:hypothetical protein
VSLLSQIEVVGHDSTQTEALPPLEFGYTRFEPEKRDFFPLAGKDLPARSLADPNLELVDLFGNGLPDVLEMNGTVRYWRNLGGGEFDLPRDMREAPAGLMLADPDVQLIDADGDGRTDLLVTSNGLSGYFPLRFGGLWDRRSFQRYRMAPSFTLKDPEVHLVDLDGDGVTDAMRSGSRLECFFNHPTEGWNGTHWVERRDIEAFPNVNFSDPRVKWADMTGDGLQDIVLVYDGNVEYWPNLGYGNWGKRIHMRHSPHFPYGYDPRRILVGDVDGDGLADMVYVDDTRVTLWINQSGNAWSDPITIKGTPPVSDVDAVRLADMLGSGISGVLWSTDAGALSREHLFFLDFTGGLKPYLLHEMDSHIGALTKVEYVASTRFYLEDQKRPAARWRTPLPFPVQVVARVEVIDHFSKGKLTTEYRYHHGYWDGAEREFRGFGRVEQLDTESFEQYDNAGLHGPEAFFAKVDRQYFSPPTLTKTWFHQGPVGDEFGDWQELDWSDEYWQGDPNLLRHTEAVNQFLRTWPQSPDSRRVKRDALRTLRGSILRTELYALDGSDREDQPYTVTESRYGLKEIEAPTGGDTERLHIFFPHLTAQRTTQWERGDDPMTQFSFTNDYDNFGQPQLQTQAACPRGWRGLEDQPAEPYLATRTRTRYASPVDPATYIHDRVVHTTSWEILNTAGKRVLDLTLLSDTSADLELIGHTRNLYDGNAFTGRTLGEVGRFGAVCRSESLVLTEKILQDVHGTGVPPYLAPSGAIARTADYPQDFRTLLPALAGYHFHTGGTGPTDPRGYFALTDRRRYDFQSPSGIGRGLVLETLDPLGDPATNPTGHRTLIAYDKYQLLPETVTDAAGLTTRAHYDYRVMQPNEVTDPNGNVTRFTFTPLGLLASTFVRGKTPMEGDQMRPGMRMEYGFLAFDQSPPEDRQPIFVRTIRHVHDDTETDVPLPERDETITTVEYSDGFGRLLQTRTQGEELRFGDEHFGGGDSVLPAQQSAGRGGDVVGQSNTNIRNPNVVVSGWQIYDNKGRVVEKYEPFFAEGWEYGQLDDKKFGQKVTMFYDPRGHVVRTVNPDIYEQRVIYGVPGTLVAPDLEYPERFDATPWEAYTYDANDNAGRTHGGDPTTQRYRHHWDTPTSIVIDALGRTIETVERDRDEPASPTAPPPPIKEYRTRMSYDIRGNLLTVTDALNRPVFRHIYDLANRKLRIDSIDAGIRRTVLDAAGNVAEQRDGKGAFILHGYDDLNRPIRLWARDGSGERLSLRERLEYGDEGNPNQSAANRTANRTANRLGKLARHFDEAGLLAFVQYDFKGNVLEKTRQVVSDAAILSVFSTPTPGGQIAAFRVDWDNTVQTTLDAEVYATSMQYDALNRIKLLTYPLDVENRRRELRPHYNRAGALEQVTLDGAPYVEHIAYNAKGQRLLIAYGNGVMTRHAYDPKTFRLVRLRTEGYSKPPASTYRPTGSVLQDFAYAYDLAGNITRICDRTPESGIPNTELGRDALDRKFSYDPLYRLRSATGRETDFLPDSPWDDMPRSTDINRARVYTEQYRYDPVGNIEELKHMASGAGFTKKRREAPAFMPGMDRRWARRAQCPRAQQDPRSA